MDCKEFQNAVSAAVDRELDAGDLEAFKDHGVKCPPCRFEYDAETVTKSVVRTRVQRAKVPADLALKISEQLDNGRSGGGKSWIGEFFRTPFVKPAIGFALAFVAVLFLLRGSTGNNPAVPVAFAANDVILQSLNTHRALTDGGTSLPFASIEPAQLTSFFSAITDYSVHLPKMKDCQLIGGGQNEFGGTKLAHVIYKHDTDIVYICQTCWATVQRGEQLSLPKEAKEELAQTGWYSRSQPDGRSVVLWVKGRTLCAAVSRMSKEDLVACLSSDGPEPQGW